MPDARRLTKDESRARWQELRALWNEYDPIGVAGGEHDDEYDSYVGEMMRLLEKDSSQQDLVAHLQSLITGHIGLSWSSELADRTAVFATKSLKWYETKWLGTYV